MNLHKYLQQKHSGGPLSVSIFQQNSAYGSEKKSFHSWIRFGQHWFWKSKNSLGRDSLRLLSGTRVNAYVIPTRSFLTLFLHRSRDLPRTFVKIEKIHLIVGERVRKNLWRARSWLARVNWRPRSGKSNCSNIKIFKPNERMSVQYAGKVSPRGGCLLKCSWRYLPTKKNARRKN